MKDFCILSLLILTNTIGFSQSFNSRRMDSLFQSLEENNKFMGSIAVSKNGKLLYAKTIGYSDIENSRKAGTNTRYRIGSISKVFTAALIFKAIEEHKISLRTTLDQYFPGIENSKKITIQNLLQHKSGLHDFTNDGSYVNFNIGAKSEKQVIEMIAGGKSDFEPNSKVAYSNPNYIVLSYILEKIYKKSFATILASRIIQPLRLKNTYYGSKIQSPPNESYSYHIINKWVKSHETDLSIPMGAGGIVSNTEDLNIFIEQLFRGKIISQKSLSAMKTMNGYHGIGVGMGMLAFPYFEHTSYGHNGAIDDFKSVLQHFPGEKLSVALVSNGSNYAIDSVVSCALGCYFNKPFAIPTFHCVALNPEVLKSYSGHYASQQIPIKIAITINENKLFGQVIGQPVFPLEATSADIFKFEQAGLILEFDAGNKQMILKQGGQKFLFTKE